MTWKPDPGLFNKAFGGGLQNGKRLVDLVQNRRDRNTLSSIADLVQQGDFNNAGSKLVGMGLVNPGLDILNLPFNRTMKQNESKLAQLTFDANQQHRVNQTQLGYSRLAQMQSNADRTHNFNVQKWNAEQNKPPAPTSAIKNFEYGEKNPEFRQYQKNNPGGVNINIDNVPLEKRTKGNLQKDIISSQVLLKQMNATKNSYRPEFLTYGGQLESFTTAQSEKFGLAPSKAKREFLKGRTNFITNTERLFNAYRKEITGAAAAVQELDRLKKSFINMSQSPSQFEAAYESYYNELKRVLRLRNKILRQGLDPRSEQGGRIFDSLFVSNSDDDSDFRANELMAQGKSEQEIMQILEAEGYDE